jgi:alpha-tubulin suppressor-like RCC1 family protein
MPLPKLTVSSRRTVPALRAHSLLLGVVLLGLAASGCGGGAVNPEPAAFTWQALGIEQLDLPGTSNVFFDPQGNPVIARGGVRRWSRESGLWEARGTDLPFPVASVDTQGNTYMPGYVLAADQRLWQRLPNLPDGLAMTTAPVADAQGNLYAAAQGAAFRLKPGATTWERLELPTGASAQDPHATPSGDRVYFTSTSLEGTLELKAGATVATRYAGEGPPTAFDEDGNSYYLRQSMIFKVAPDGTRTQLVDALSAPEAAPRFESGLARDRRGAFYAHALDSTQTTPYVLKLEPGASQWKILAPMLQFFDQFVVRDDGLVVEFSPTEPRVYELYGTGSDPLNADATEDGVHFSTPSVTLLAGDTVTVGLTMRGATTTAGLSITAPPDFTATPSVALVRHGLAGTLTVSVRVDAAPGTQHVTVKSPKGDKADLEVVVIRPALDRNTQRQHTLAAGATMLGVKEDGTVWSWPSTPESANPTQRATRVQGMQGVRSVAQDLKGYGGAYAVRVDGRVMAWNTFRPELAPVLVPGLSNIIQVAAGQGYAAALDASGQVWAWEAGDETHFNVGQPGWVPAVKVEGLTDVVALAQLTALKADGTVWTWLNYVFPPKPERVEGVGGAALVGYRWALRGDGSVQRLPSGSPAFQRNDIIDLDASLTSRPTAGGHLLTTDSLLMLRSDGTVWDGSVFTDSDSNDTTHTSSTSAGNVQLDAPPDVRAVATIVSQRAVLTGDGSVWMQHIVDGRTAFDKVPDLDSVRDPANTQDLALLASPDATVISPGTTVSIPVTVARTGGFSGPITVSASSLPAGLSFTGFTVPAAATSATLTFTATAALGHLGPTDVALQLTGGTLHRTALVTLRTPFTPGFSHPTLAAGASFGLAIKADGTVWAWGSNSFGQLGQGAVDTTRHGTAVQVPGLSNIVQVAAGDGHALALDASGAVWGWGDNQRGQAGAATTPVTSPSRVMGLPQIQGIAAAGQVSFALAVDGSVWGVGATSTRLVDPSALAAISTSAYLDLNVLLVYANGNVQGISSGNTCSLSGQHVVRAAGPAGNYLVLRDNLTVANLISSFGCSPKELPELTGTVAMTQQLMAKGDGTVWTLDRANPGLPTGTTPPATGGFQVPGIAGAVDVAGYAGALALVLKSDGTVWAWGSNGSGQAGGTSSTATTPQQVPGLSGVRQP